jgi:hypothetical protein
MAAYLFIGILITLFSILTIGSGTLTKGIQYLIWKMKDNYKTKLK